LREGLHTGVAKRYNTASIEDTAADSARRGKDEGGQRLAHSAEMEANGIGNPGHSAPSLRRKALQGKQNVARFVP